MSDTDPTPHDHGAPEPLPGCTRLAILARLTAAQRALLLNNVHLLAVDVLPDGDALVLDLYSHPGEPARRLGP